MDLEISEFAGLKNTTVLFCFVFQNKIAKCFELT